MKKKRKQKTPKQKKEIELWELCKEYIRKRDNMECQRCGKVIDSYYNAKGEMKAPGADTSHVHCKNIYKSLKYDDMNLKLLCMYCHKWWHNVPLESAKWFEDTFPKRWKYLHEKKQHTKVMNELAIDELINHYEVLLHH